MTEPNWAERIPDIIRRAESRGREEYVEIVDDVVDGMDAPAILAKHKIKPDGLTSALSLVTSVLHGSRPAPTLAEGGWYERDEDKLTVAPKFAAAWRSARGGGTA